MSRDNASLLDIVNAAKRVLQFAEGLDKSALATNEEKQSAILYQVIVMGEATKRLSSEFRTQHPEIPWKDIAGMRDILAHQYDRLNINTLWDVIKRDRLRDVSSTKFKPLKALDSGTYSLDAPLWDCIFLDYAIALVGSMKIK